MPPIGHVAEIGKETRARIEIAASSGTNQLPVRRRRPSQAKAMTIRGSIA